MTNTRDDLYIGPIQIPGFLDPLNNTTLPATNNAGAGSVSRVHVKSVTPIAASATALALAQTLSAAGPLTLTAGTGIRTNVQSPIGETMLLLDTSRCVTLTGVSGTVAVSFTITGYDTYGQRMTQTLTGPSGAATVTTLKAFRGIISIVGAGATTNTVSAGISSTFGINFLCLDAGYIVDVSWGGVLALDTGTFTNADTTYPATSATGDVRGTYLPSSAADGTKRLQIAYYLSDSVAGPNAKLYSTSASSFGALGAPQA